MIYNNNKKNISICGDSFVTDWLIKHKDYPRRPTLLSHYRHVVNVAKARVVNHYSDHENKLVLVDILERLN